MATAFFIPPDGNSTKRVIMEHLLFFMTNTERQRPLFHNETFKNVGPKVIIKGAIIITP